MESEGKGAREGEKKESAVKIMIFILQAISECKRISLKELFNLAEDFDRSVIVKFLNVLEKGRYLRKKKELNNIYYSLTPAGNLLAQKEEKEVESKFKKILIKLKPKVWERSLAILRFVEEKKGATLTEIHTAIREQFPVGSSKPNLYKDIDQLRLKGYLDISKYSAVHENVYEVGKAGFEALERTGKAREKRVYTEFDFGMRSSKSRDLWAYIGEIAVPWIIIEGTGEFMYTKENIVARYVNLPLELPSDLEALVSRQKAALARKEKETGGVIWDGKRYRLISFHKTRFQDSATGEEVPGMYFEFGPSRYSTHLALEGNLDAPGVVYSSKGQPITIRKKYLDPAWDPLRPNPYLSNSFGVNILVICEDNKIILVLRNLTEVKKGKGVFNLSIDEGMSKPSDEEIPGVPSVFKCAERGLHEELGLIVPSEDIKFFSFGVDPLRHEYGILGTVESDLTSNEVVNHFKTRARDRFEVERKPFKVPFDPCEVFEFMQQNKPWTPWAIIGLFQTLANYFGFEKTEKAAKAILTEENLWARYVWEHSQ